MSSSKLAMLPAKLEHVSYVSPVHFHIQEEAWNICGDNIALKSLFKIPFLYQIYIFTRKFPFSKFPILKSQFHHHFFS